MIELCCEYMSVRCICLYVLVCTVHLSVVTYHVTYVFQSESTLYSRLDVKEPLARSRRQMIELCCEYLSVR